MKPVHLLIMIGLTAIVLSAGQPFAFLGAKRKELESTKTRNLIKHTHDVSNEFKNLRERFEEMSQRARHFREMLGSKVDETMNWINDNKSNEVVDYARLEANNSSLLSKI